MQLEVDVSVVEHVEDAVVQELLKLAGEMVKMGVGFVGCQMCVHPVLREELERNVSNLTVTVYGCASLW